jgi:hypothetical protein
MIMKVKIHIRLFILLLLCTTGYAQEQTSKKDFLTIAVTNKIDFIDSKFDQARFGCGFLLKYRADTFAVTAKHLLMFIKSDEMKKFTLENYVKSWSMFPLDQKEEVVITDKLLNENKSESLQDRSIYLQDWLLFSIKKNASKIKSLEPRLKPLNAGEKLYVLGWTRKMESGSQRVYEFEYYKTIDNRILLKDLVVPPQLGGLSGGPLVDEQGLVVGIVSGGTLDPDTNKKYFSCCPLDDLIRFIDNYKKNGLNR